jgi:phosphotransacetylase
MNKDNSMLSAAGILGIAIFVGGCASSGERPDGELRTAESSIQQAVSSDAREFEPVLLNQAQNKVADAEELIETEEYREAGRLLEQASVDAQLAGARSHTAKAKQAVEQINTNIEALRQRLNQSR